MDPIAPCNFPTAARALRKHDTATFTGSMTLRQADTLLGSHKDLRGRENLKQPVHQIGHQQRARFPVSGVLGFFSKGHPVPNLRKFDKYDVLQLLRPGGYWEWVRML